MIQELALDESSKASARPEEGFCCFVTVDPSRSGSHEFSGAFLNRCLVLDVPPGEPEVGCALLPGSSSRALRIGKEAARICSELKNMARACQEDAALPRYWKDSLVHERWQRLLQCFGPAAAGLQPLSTIAAIYGISGEAEDKLLLPLVDPIL